MVKLTRNELQKRYPTLDKLFEAIKSGELDELGEAVDWAELPIYADEDWDNPTEVWSWDDTRMIRGTCTEDMKLVPRVTPKRDRAAYMRKYRAQKAKQYEIEETRTFGSRDEEYWEVIPTNKDASQIWEEYVGNQTCEEFLQMSRESNPAISVEDSVRAYLREMAPDYPDIARNFETLVWALSDYIKCLLANDS